MSPEGNHIFYFSGEMIFQSPIVLQTWVSVHRPTSEWVSQGKSQESRLLTSEATFQKQLHPAFKRDWGSALRTCADALPPLKWSHVRDTELPPWTWP